VTAYAGVWSVVSDGPVSPAAMAAARKLVGSMFDIGGIPTRSLRLADGTTIAAIIVNGIPKVVIKQPQAVFNVVSFPTALWVPRGFVVYPAWHSEPFGVGLPVIPDGSAGPYDPTNLAPGLAKARWTAGGPCGEVLLSPDLNAGYQANKFALQTPLLSDKTKGPTFSWSGTGAYDARTPDGKWSAYRMEFVYFTQHFSDESPANCQALFEAVNTYRTGLSLPPVNLMPRGWYHPAQIMTSIMQAAGASTPTNPNYPATYATPADRLTKEGYGAQWLGQTFSSFNRDDTPLAFEFLQNGGSAASVLSAWLADPTMTTQLQTNEGAAVISDTGFRGGYWAFNLIERTHWIEAGNQSWQSADTDLPPLSWMGFASLNLAWETYRATLNPDPTTQPTTPFLSAGNFIDSHGDCWLKYPRSDTPGLADYEPAMSRHIFMRGRAIALAPNGGLVWGATLIANGANDRLVALIHHPADQPSDAMANGSTRYLRVWWCDIPTRPNLRAAPQETITGTDSTDTWGWKGGDLLDLGVMPDPSSGSPASGSPNALKMASQWRFSPDGSKAICLRDYAAFADYASIYDTGGASFVVRAYYGARPRAVELTFALSPTAVTTTVTFHDYTAGWSTPSRPIAKPLDCTDSTGTVQLWEYTTVPVAVDYDANGNVLYAYSGFLDDVFASGDMRYVYLGTGSASVAYPTDLSYRALLGAQVKTASQNVFPWTFQIADVVNGVYASEGGMPALAFNSATSELTFTTPPCFPFTTALVHDVRFFRTGALISDTWYPAPDGLVFTYLTPCIYLRSGFSGIFIDLPQAMSRTLQLFAATRFGKNMTSYQLAPVPIAAVYVDVPPSSPDCNCNLDISAALRFMTTTELSPRGGGISSDVQLPDADWLIYAKVV